MTNALRSYENIELEDHESESDCNIELEDHKSESDNRRQQVSNVYTVKL